MRRLLALLAILALSLMVGCIEMQPDHHGHHDDWGHEHHYDRR